MLLALVKLFCFLTTKFFSSRFVEKPRSNKWDWLNHFGAECINTNIKQSQHAQPRATSMNKHHKVFISAALKCRITSSSPPFQPKKVVCTKRRYLNILRRRSINLSPPFYNFSFGVIFSNQRRACDCVKGFISSTFVCLRWAQRTYTYTQAVYSNKNIFDRVS